jgi:hypothetical protein
VLHCRCDAVPLRALQSASRLFSHDRSCQAKGDLIIPMEGSFYEPFQTSRRSLLQDSGVADVVMPFTEASASTGRKLVQVQPEFGAQRERALFNRATTVRQVLVMNLRNTSWLGDFEPMLMTCPLTARKVSPEAVSEFASIAWRCDGLGFSWECLSGEPMV